VLFNIQSIIDYAISIRTNSRAERLGLTYAPSLEARSDRSMDIGFLKYIRMIIGLIVFSMWFWSSSLHAEKIARILVISNNTDTPYRETIAGFKSQIGTATKHNITELSLAQIQTLSNAEFEGLKPDLIFTLGNESLKWVSLKTSRIPIVATMVLKDDTFKRASNITGVSLSYTLQTQVQWLKRFFPQQTSVAILYNPAENAGTVNEAKAISQQAGLKLVPIPVETPKELPYALEQLATNVELLLAIPDETVMSANTAREVLLASFRNKVPLIGLSENWVKSGAFYALSWDYSDLGKQCGDMAFKVLTGTPISTIATNHPRKVAYTINAKIAAHMSIDIPSELITSAKKVFN
jgi:putative tryptophan/tyrosine transport system substrate-binding protein